MKPIIEVKGLSFTYPAGVKALKNIDLTINEGEVLAIIGQNGSGKTTLVKHFNGLLKPTKGEVIVDGELTNDLTTAYLSKKVGYVFQNPDDQIFNSTVFNEVAFGPRNLELSSDVVKERVSDALGFVGLKGIEKKHPLDLSLNDKKLVAIASILAMKPKVIILDEPTTGQDHEGIKHVESLINELRKEHTVILISHNMSLVAKVATRVLILYDAERLLEGSPKKAFVKNKLLSKTYLAPPIITQLCQRVKGLKNDTLTINELIEQIQ